MASKKLLTVFGATGNQGGSVISTVLDSPALSAKYRLRGVTRDPTKPSSQALAGRGVEVVKGDLGDAPSVAAAVRGAYGVFAVTNFWEAMSGDVEFAQGKAIADAALAAGVRHVVWSSLPYTAKLTAGALPHLAHFDAKARVEEYLEEAKRGTGTAATYFMPGFFTSNLKTMIQRGPDGTPTWAAPWDPEATRLPAIDVRVDTGKFVLGVFEAGPEAADGKQIHAVSEWITPAAAVSSINAFAGTSVKAVRVPRDVFKGHLPENIAEELTETLELIGDWKYYGKDAEDRQADSDRFFLSGESKVAFKQYVESNGPWQWD